MRLKIDGEVPDPDLAEGGYLAIERADGRSLWRQRFVVVKKTKTGYVLKPVSVTHGYWSSGSS